MTVLIMTMTAFASGVIGACVGAMTAVIMCGVAVCIAMAAAISGSNFDWLSNFAFGMFLGPHVAFAPACAAAAYAKMKGYVSDSKDIFLPLISIKKADVLIVSGLFGILGWYVNAAMTSVFPGKMDTVALTIVIICMIGRVMFSKKGLLGLIGEVPEGKKRFDPRTCQSWLPHQTTDNSLQLVLLGLCVGCISGYLTTMICDIATETNNDALFNVAAMPVWAIAIIWCAFMAAGYKLPIAHHIGLVAGYAAKMAYLSGQSGDSCIFWGIAFGLAATYTADLLGKAFTAYGDGFVDPPSMAIAFWSLFLLYIFPANGMMTSQNVISIIIPVAVLIICLAIAVKDAMTMKLCK